MFKTINLKELYNHKFIYDKAEISDEEKGLDNTYILRSDIINNRLMGLNNVIFELSNNYYDNIICDKQKITINDKIKKLHILGFSYWGSTNTFFEIIMEDNSKQLIKIAFIDWVQEARKNYETKSWYETDIGTITKIKTSGEINHLVNFHHSITEIDFDQPIKKIILPEHFLVHIFAITIER